MFDLHQRLVRAGFHVNLKRLYRLADARPIHHIDLNIAGAICRELAIGLDELVQFEQPDFVLEQLDTALQYRLDELLTKKNGGRLAEDEEETLDGLLRKSRDITHFRAISGIGAVGRDCVWTVNPSARRRASGLPSVDGGAACESGGRRGRGRRRES